MRVILSSLFILIEALSNGGGAPQAWQKVPLVIRVAGRKKFFDGFVVSRRSCPVKRRLAFGCEGLARALAGFRLHPLDFGLPVGYTKRTIRNWGCMGRKYRRPEGKVDFEGG
jgi:hypothetical protein